MEILEFKESLTADIPPPELNAHLKALWYDAKGKWDIAHNITQGLNDREAAWVHAYLHRKEGDSGNAGYWYDRACKQMPSTETDKEWDELVAFFINK